MFCAYFSAGVQVRDHSWLTGKENIIRKVSKEVREANKKKRVGTASQPGFPGNIKHPTRRRERVPRLPPVRRWDPDTPLLVKPCSQPILPVNDGPGPKNVLIVEDG